MIRSYIHIGAVMVIGVTTVTALGEVALPATRTYVATSVAAEATSRRSADDELSRRLISLETTLGGYAKKADIGSRGVTNITDGVTSGTYNEETRTANINNILIARIPTTNDISDIAEAAIWVNLSHTNAVFDTEVNAVISGKSSSIVSNVTASVKSDIDEMIGGDLATYGGGGFAGLVAAILAALAWLKKRAEIAQKTETGDFTAENGTVHTIDVSYLSALTITLPATANITTALITNVIMDNVSGSEDFTSIAFNPSESAVHMDGDAMVSAGKRTEFSCLWNGSVWLIAANKED